MNTKKLFTALWITAACSILIIFSTTAQYHSPEADEALKPAVIIEEISVVGEAKLGDSFEILVRYNQCWMHREQ